MDDLTRPTRVQKPNFLDFSVNLFFARENNSPRGCSEETPSFPSEAKDRLASHAACILLPLSLHRNLNPMSAELTVDALGALVTATCVAVVIYLCLTYRHTRRATTAVALRARQHVLDYAFLVV